jgi:hypothetical protein
VTNFQTVRGFEDVWRAPAPQRPLVTTAILKPDRASSGEDVRARLQRIVNRAPEVMVKVTGRTRDPGHLRSHLNYISRNGQQALETQDGAPIAGRSEVRELSADWAAAQLADHRTRTSAPFSHSVILSMPAGTDPVKLRDAARAFADDMFAGRHEYVFTLHTDTPRPHVHLSICSRGYAGERLNPKKGDLEAWRQVFAQALRDRGVEAEATPRRARGVTRKAERGPLRRMRERQEAGQGEPARVRRAAYREAANAAFGGEAARMPWEAKLTERQAKVRGFYLAQAQLLRQSPDPTDQVLGAEVDAFVRSMPQPDTQRLAFARELRTANALLRQRASPQGREIDR